MNNEPCTLPPSNIVAEVCVLGSMLIDPSCIPAVADVVLAEDFYRLEHGELFIAILAVWQRGDPVDAVSVRDQLEAAGALERVGEDNLHDILRGVPSAANVGYYARTVRAKATLRNLMLFSSGLYGDAAGTLDDDVEALLGGAEERLYALDYRIRERDPAGTCLADAATDYLTDAREQRPGVPCGLLALDALTNGIAPGELMTVAGLTGAGKSTLAVHMAAHAAKAGHGVVYVSCEMPRRQVAKRFLQSIARVEAKKLRTGDWSQQQDAELASAQATFAGWSVYIEGRSRTIPQVAAVVRAQAVRWRRPVDLVLVDYLQQMTPHTGKSRYEQVTAMARAVKDLAMDRGCAVVSVSQFNRQADHAARPSMAMLRETGEIEQASDFVLLMHRPTDKEFTGKGLEVWLRLAKGRDTGDTFWPDEAEKAGPGHVALKLQWLPWFTAFEETAECTNETT